MFVLLLLYRLCVNLEHAYLMMLLYQLCQFGTCILYYVLWNRENETMLSLSVRSVGSIVYPHWPMTFHLYQRCIT